MTPEQLDAIEARAIRDRDADALALVAEVRMGDAAEEEYQAEIADLRAEVRRLTEERDAAFNVAPHPDFPPSSESACHDDALIVRYVIPHYFFTMSEWPEEGVGASVTMRSDAKGPFHGYIRGIENDEGEWLIDVSDLDGELVIRTRIENVERIDIT